MAVCVCVCTKFLIKTEQVQNKFRKDDSPESFQSSIWFKPQLSWIYIKWRLGRKYHDFFEVSIWSVFQKWSFPLLNTLIFHARNIFLTLGGHLLLIQLSFLNIQPSNHGPSSVSSPSVLLALSGLPDFTVLLRISPVKIKSCYFIQGLEQSWACVKNYIAVFTKNFFFYS